MAEPIFAPFRVTAPGRVNLIGEHTDYNDGFVLPMALGKGVALAVTPRSDRRAVFRSTSVRGETVLDLSSPLGPIKGSWTNYPAGVLAGYQELGWRLPGFEAHVSADLPVGGGLSSSAALEVATATAVEAMCAQTLPPEQKALLCQRAEHRFAGVPCGIMDQFAVTFGRAGHAMLIDCQSRAMRFIPLDRGVSVLVVNSGVRHSLADGEYALRRDQCRSAAAFLAVPSLRMANDEILKAQKHLLPEVEFSRARHVLSENSRTIGFASALENSDWPKAGSLMWASHNSLRDDYEVSCPELDLLVEISRGIPGVFGCRMTGGGFGGCVVALVESALAVQARERMRDVYRAETGIEAEAFVTLASNGPEIAALDGRCEELARPFDQSG